MVQFGPKFDLEDARQRAAEIRAEWTLSERAGRAGLPPDIPFKLRNLLSADLMRRLHPAVALALHCTPKA
jgi:hypothetical protein